MGRTQKVRMFKRIPRNPLKSKYVCATFIKLKGTSIREMEFPQIKEFDLSKSVYGIVAKNNLSFCNMNARSARKAMRERV